MMRILTVYAHPDDESFGPAAALAKYARQGARIYGVFFTRGEQGEPTITPAPSPQELGRLRERDLNDATRAIGYYRVDVLDYGDGSLPSVPGEVLKRHVLDAMLAYRPDVVLTFGPGGITRHGDHVAVHEATRQAFEQAQEQGLGPRELYYDAVPPERAAEMHIEDVPDGRPNTWIDVAETQAVKLEALRCHARHIADARERVKQLEQQPQTRATFHRAIPPVGDGETVKDFLVEADPDEAEEEGMIPPSGRSGARRGQVGGATDHRTMTDA